MKFLLFVFLLCNSLFAKVYYAKVEPYELRDISSNVSGLITYIDEDLLGSKLSKKAYMRIDDELDVKELKYIDDKLEYLRDIVKVNEKVLENLTLSLQKKQENYNKVVSLKFKSSVEKDKEYYDLITNQNLNLSTQKEIQNLKIQITDLKLRQSQLQRSVKDKHFIANGFVLYEILVRPGQVVSISTPLAKVADTSRAKLTIFLDEADVIDAKKRIVYMDGKKTSYKISRILNIADSKNISKYMAQIIIPSPNIFSKLIKIELK